MKLLKSTGRLEANWGRTGHGVYSGLIYLIIFLKYLFVLVILKRKKTKLQVSRYKTKYIGETAIKCCLLDRSSSECNVNGTGIHVP